MRFSFNAHTGSGQFDYCPYGVLVESMPFCDSPDDMKRQKEWGWKETQNQMYERAKRDLASTKPSDLSFLIIA